LERLPAGIARGSDGLLDFVVLAFAAWTIVYHVCLLLRLGTVWAAVAEGLALVACGWFVARRTTPSLTDEPAEPAVETARSGRLRAAVAVQVATGLGAAALYAFTDTRWSAITLLWLLAAGAAFFVTYLRPAARGFPVESSLQAGLGAAVALVWAAAFACLSLLTVRSAEDDTYYVRLAAWVAEHGVFPLRDTLFSDQVYPAIFYPPISSYEAAVGTVARVTGLAVPDLVYYVVAPVTSVLGVLALWRLYRTWRTPMVAIALSVAMVFLLFDAPTHRALGNTILSRSWHGKVILLAVLVPLLFVFIQRYLERPTRARLLLLAAAGVAAVGLSTTGVFLVPIIAVACFAPAMIDSARQAVAGLLATAAYPLGAAVAAMAVGERTAAATDFYARPGFLARSVLDEGLLAFVAVGAILLAPSLISRRLPARMAAATTFLVGLLLVPFVTEAMFDLTGFTRLFWRLFWAVPVAALVGVLAVGLSARARSPVLRVLPAALLCAAFAAWGALLWSERGIELASRPVWKRPPASIAEARWILPNARSGDSVLAPRDTSQTIAVMSGDVYPVAPRVFYTLGLDAPAAHDQERVLLQAFADTGLDGPIPRVGRPPEADEVVRALELVGVDLACVVDNAETRDVLLQAGYSPVEGDGSVICMRAPGDGDGE
jgi:hypothetical protein